MVKCPFCGASKVSERGCQSCNPDRGPMGIFEDYTGPDNPTADLDKINASLEDCDNES